MALRKVLITVVGHVDHGKTTLLDRVRSTTVAEREAGLITQAIGASIIPKETIQRLAGPLLEKLHITLLLPGILAIDTPGHAAFSHLRKRGGALADIALVVVDVNEGFMPQTYEAIEILKAAKTPFILVANKIDLIPNWRLHPDLPILQSIEAQSPASREIFEKKVYELVTLLFEKFGFNADRFDRVSDFTEQIAVVPISAKKGVGLAELLMVIVGLSQKFLGAQLNLDSNAPARGTVLEVKEEKGLGTTLDVIFYDGTIHASDTIVVGGLIEPVVTKIKALFEPGALADMREAKTKFVSVKEATAACGVKIVAKDLMNVIGGMPIESCNDPAQLNSIKERVQASVHEVVVETDVNGVIAKADSLGSLEALLTLLRGKNIPIKRAFIGDITKKDINDAEATFNQDPIHAAILAFNVKLPEGVEKGNIGILQSNIIYRLIEDFEAWQDTVKRAVESKELQGVTRPFKIEVLRGYVFSQSNPAIVGCEILGGIIKTNKQFMNKDGKILTSVKGLQRDRENVEQAVKGEQVAVSMPDVVVGRQIEEGNILYSCIHENEFRVLKEYKEYLTSEEKSVLKEILDIMRKNNIVWGV